MPTQTVLVTAAEEDFEPIAPNFENSEHEILHLPLEVYVSRNDDSRIAHVLSKLDKFENIVYSNLRNARFFVEQLEQFDKIDAVKNTLNLTVNEATFHFLEGRGIVAVHPQDGSKPIDLVELMLRLQRLGKTLYPCGAHQREDFPGFLEELDIPVTELDVFDLEGPSDEDLASHKEKLQKKSPDVVIFHSRRSVNRMLAAFRDLDFQSIKVISADKGITKKLEENNISVDAEGEGNWQSILEML